MAELPKGMPSTGAYANYGLFAGGEYTAGTNQKPNAIATSAEWKINPIGYIDGVARLHDMNRTHAEQLYPKSDFGALGSTEMRKDAFWQGDKEMIINLLKYEPVNKFDAMMRDVAITGLVAKAFDPMPGAEYYGDRVLKDWPQMAALDPKNYANSPAKGIGDAKAIGERLEALTQTMRTTGLEQLYTSGLSVQAIGLFNQHISDIDPTTLSAYSENAGNSTRMATLPKYNKDSGLYESKVLVDGKWG